MLTGAVLAVAGCRSTATPRAPHGERGAIEVRAGTGAPAGVAPEFLPALAALEQALAAGEDAEARRILDLVMLREPTGPALALTRSFERVLRGRECLTALELALEVESPEGATAEDVEHPRPIRVVLVARSELALVLRPGPATLRISSAVAGGSGADARRVQSWPCPTVREIAVEPGRDTRIEIWRSEFAIPRGALAARERYALDLRAGVLMHAGVELPAQDPRVEPAEELAVRATADGASQPVRAEDFVASVAQRKLGARALLERAVRVPTTERDRALDGLWPLASDLSLAEVGDLVPSLRWLSSAQEPGGDPEHWRSWLARRADLRERTSPRPRLALPRAEP